MLSVCGLYLPGLIPAPIPPASRHPPTVGQIPLDTYCCSVCEYVFLLFYCSKKTHNTECTFLLYVILEYRETPCSVQCSLVIKSPGSELNLSEFKIPALPLASRSLATGCLSVSICEMGRYIRSCFAELSGGLHEIILAKHSEYCLAYAKCSKNVSYSIFPFLVSLTWPSVCKNPPCCCRCTRFLALNCIPRGALPTF